MNAAVLPYPGEWPSPDFTLLGDGRFSAPPFPRKTLGRWSGWAADFAASKSAPVDYAAAGLLAAGAACIGDARRVKPWEGWSEAPALWVVMVGDPSAAKTPIFGPVVDALNDLGRWENADFDKRRRTYEADKRQADERRVIWESEVAKAVKQGESRPDKPSDADAPPAPSLRRIITSDTTVEALTPLFRDNPKGLCLVRDELSGWIADFNKYGGGGEAAFFLSRFNGGLVSVDRKSDGHVSVPRALLSVFGGIQPEPFRDLLLKRADDGFVSRLLPFFPDPVPRMRPDRPADTDALACALKRLRTLPWVPDDDAWPKPRTLSLSQAAGVQFEDWWKQNGEAATGASGLVAGFLGKAGGVVLRLALVLQFLDWAAGPEHTEPELVGEVAMLSAITLFEDYFSPMAARLYGGAAMSREEALARRLLRHLRTVKKSVVNVQDLRGGGTGLRITGEVENILAELAEAGWARPAPGRDGHGPGRQRKDWAINPALWCKP